MPLYDFMCTKCAKVWEARTPVGEDYQTCECGSLAKRQFSVCRMIQTPRHFQLARGWNLPKTPAEVAHMEKMEETADRYRGMKAKPYRQYVEEKLAADRRITLGGG